MTTAKRTMATEASPSLGNNNRPAASRLTTMLLVLLGVCCLISISVNMMHGDSFVHHHPEMAIAKAMKDFKGGRPRRWKNTKDSKEAIQNDAKEKGNDEKVEQRQEEGDGISEHHNPHSNHHKENFANLDLEAEAEEESEEKDDEHNEANQGEKDEEEMEEDEKGDEGEIKKNKGEKDEEETEEAEPELKGEEEREKEEREEEMQENEGETVEEAADDKGVDETGEREVQGETDEQEREAREEEETKNDEEIKEEDEDESNIESIKRIPSKLGGLTCDKWGGPSEESAAEMVYWSDIPSDQDFISPFRAKHGQHKKYMTFEPDGGGWNNIRMAMETVVGLAIAMGRTLVLPPAQGMYLLKKDKKKQNTDFSFADFFPMHEMAEENDGLEVITTEQFLLAEAMTGNLVDKKTGKPSFPPYNRTNWDGEDVKELKEWLRNVTYIEHMWKPEHCLAAFPASGDHKDVLALEKMQNTIVEQGFLTDRFLGNPVDVDGSPLERMHENMASRGELCVYDEAMQKQLVVHFMCYHKMRIRYLVHFYAFLYFEDWRQDLWMKRFMRDHMRYMDEIQCAAARVVEKVRERSRQLHPELNGAFDTFHIRRGDFQFRTTRIDADAILANSKEFLQDQKTVFIATDERDKSFFKPLQDVYDVVFLDDFMDVLKDVNTNFYGMIDQLVAAKGDVFLGCWFSTFTGFINRMRGYYSVKLKQPGYENGTLPTTYYYVTAEKMFQMHQYHPLSRGFFNREYPTSWRQIDKDIEEMAKPRSMREQTTSV